MKYLFAETKTLKPICLICSTTVAIVKKYNLERYFKQNHSKFNQDYPEGSVLRTDFVNRKKRELCCQQNLFKKQSKEVESMVKASYKISLLLTRKKKPFSDGEIVKGALSIFAQHCEDQNVKRHAESISLSRNTVTRRMEDMSIDIGNQIQDTVTKCKYFSLALDETCDLTSMSQLSIFVRCIDEEFNVFQDLLEICQLKTTSKREDVFLKIKECVEKTFLAFERPSANVLAGKRSLACRDRSFEKRILVM
uniref:Zinc finger MYM-type protein 6 n=1 Tax=Cacopsylla melanoneura TaxID=428564 RepID=A0A8D8UWN6_9HEMI